MWCLCPGADPLSPPPPQSHPFQGPLGSCRLKPEAVMSLTADPMRFFIYSESTEWASILSQTLARSELF